MIKKLNIAQKLTGTYLVIILAAIISGIFCLYTLFKYQDIDNEMISENIPCLEQLKQIQNQSNEINKLSKNWIYLSNLNDKNTLLEITKNDLPTSIKSLKKIAKNCTNSNEQKLFKQTLINNQTILKSIHKSTLLLSDIDAFFDEEVVNQVVDIYSSKIEKKIKENNKIYSTLIQLKTERQSIILKDKKTLINQLTIIVFLAVLAILTISILSVFYSKKKISSPLNSFKNIIDEVTLGNVKPIKLNDHSDEIAEMQNALSRMINGLKEKVLFANNVGNGNYSTQIQLLSENDSLGLSLIDMSNKLQSNEKKILSTQESLNIAQAISKIGNWEFNFFTKKIFWSHELFAIFEIPETSDFNELVLSYKNKIHPDDKNYLKELINYTAISGNDFVYEFRLICDDNRIKYVSGGGFAIKNSKNKVIELKGVIQDITERKIIENELFEAKIIAENLAKAKDEFMSSMSHEIRTPLNGIIGFTEILIKSKNLQADQLKQLEAIKTSEDILLVIINDILDIAKIESGKMTIEQNPLNLRELSELIVDTFAVKINEKQLNVTINIDSKTPLLVAGDSVRMSQIFFNFISNAIKFTPKKGDISLSIQPISFKEKEVLIQFLVKDSGIGIPKDKLDTVFEAFVQTSNDTARKYGGTGLGLTIVKKLVELMNGSVRVESIENSGTTFIMEIPMKVLKIIDEKLNENNSEPANLEVSNDSTVNKKIKILLAEDNLINQLLAQTVLAQFNYEVVTVENGLLALEEVQNNKYDLILMDLMMPEMDGYEATSKIRALENITLKNIPIIALTADVTNSVIVKCTELGMNGYLSKPFDANTLKSKINNLIM